MGKKHEKWKIFKECWIKNFKLRTYVVKPIDFKSLIRGPSADKATAGSIRMHVKSIDSYFTLLTEITPCSSWITT
jgi:hypothetical protein